VNWFLIEKKIPYTQKPPRPSPHPFGQVPCLTDDGGVEVFESGAILLYLADLYGGTTKISNSADAKQRAKYTKW
jgi:glutathione S-transferase